jgi:cation diffusion facilitator CzcD-associated flavoprotein CzcO
MRTCVIGAGPCGLAAVKNLLQVGCRDVVCYDEHTCIGGNWAFTEDPGRASVHDCTHTISSRRLSSFVDVPMPDDYPDFPSHRQMLAYFTAYARRFELEPYIQLGSRVESCALDEHGRWTVRVDANGERRTETFDNLVVCSGHHRDPFVPQYPGTFTGTVVHSSAYKRPDPYRGMRVLVVGAGNSAVDIAVDVAGSAERTALSVREGTYVVPKLVFGRPVDVVYAYWRCRLPEALLRLTLKCWLRLATGAWKEYGLPSPTGLPLAKPPTVSSNILEALRDRRVRAVRGIERYDGRTVYFAGGEAEEFDAVVMATGFRVSFPFLPSQVTAAQPLYLRMTHPTVSNLYFVGLFQPVGCIWRLADHQARIAALRISGRLSGPHDLHTRARPGLEVDYRRFERQLRRELSGSA